MPNERAKLLCNAALALKHQVSECLRQEPWETGGEVSEAVTA